MNDFELARLKYKPEKIQCLFLAEAPPSVDSKRFFYFEEVPVGDSLFLQTMRAVFNIDSKVKAKDIRVRKAEYLSKFRESGFFLEDASLVPMPRNPTESMKRRLLQAQLPDLINKLASYVHQKTPVILISKPVYDICYSTLKRAGLNIINDYPIPFPLGFQEQYRAGISNCLSVVNKNKR